MGRRAKNDISREEAKDARDDGHLFDEQEREWPQDGGEDSFQQYLRDISCFSLLTPEQESAIARQVASGDDQARQRLINANLRLVVSVAKRYTSSGVPLLDLVQEGNLGLLRATEKFDPARGLRFSTYATWWIRSTMSRALKEHMHFVHIPEYLMVLLNKMKRTTHQLSQQLGREPFPEEIAHVLHLTEERLLELQLLEEPVLSLDASLSEEDTYSLADVLEDAGVQTPERLVMDSTMQKLLFRGLETLDARERKIIELRYGLFDGQFRTLQEVGAILTLSVERIRQLEIKATGKLRLALQNPSNTSLNEEA